MENRLEALGGEGSNSKRCPDCAETIKADANVCRFCGYRFDGSDASGQHTPVPAAATALDPSSFGSREWMLTWALLSAALMLIGAFGPWIKALGQTVAGTDGGNDGWLVAAGAAIGGLLFLLTRANKGAGILGLLGGAIGAFVTIHDRSHITHVISSGGGLTQALVRVGWGLNLAMVASLSFALAGAVWLLAVASKESALVDQPSAGGATI